MNRMKKIALLTLMVSIIVPLFSLGQSVVSSKHNLSVSGPGTVKADTETQICIFCHTPHSSLPAAPLWNRNDPGISYTLYQSSTLQAAPGQPDGSAILCLSCHDGTIALGNVVSRTSDITFAGGITTMPAGGGNLTTDLSDDHPVSFTYSVASSGDNQIKAAPVMPAQLENGKVQCVSCHDPHNDINGKFLVATKQYSDLCFKCHDRNFWSSSSHNLSTATWNSSGTDPWAHIEVPYATVAENACENCHDPHNAGGNIRLLKSGAEENNCLDCHNGNVAATDIQTQMLKTYSHDVFSYNNLHDPTEAALTGATPHIECVDCHNPHAVNNSSAVAPMANGFLAEVQGIDISGNAVYPIVNEYELCFRCHADNSITASYTPRQLGDNNVRLEFTTTNVSHHAVVGPGNNPSPRGLINGLSASSQVYCTDCHASDGSAPAGPHGSIYPRILKANYNLNDYTGIGTTDPAVLAVEFALCAQCHDMNVVQSIHDTMKSGHVLKYSSCNICHDPHGVNGNSTNNSYLINLSTTATGPLTGGEHFIQINGDGTGICAFVCHAKSHKHKTTSPYN